MLSIPLHITETHTCSYLEGNLTRSVFVHPSMRMDTRLYSALIDKGFRRSGNDVYAPHCPECQACIAVRIPVDQFRLSRSQMRCRRKNQAVTARIKPAEFDSAHYSLYMKYQQLRHPGDSMADSSPEDYIRFLGSDWCNTCFVEFLLQDKLMAVAVVDVLERGLSAVYTFFDPEYAQYSPGTWAVLWQIEYAVREGLDYVYLGYWIEACRKMAYKNNFKPLQGFIDGEWVFTENAI